MKKHLVLPAIVIGVLSGWIAFGITLAGARKDIRRLSGRIETLQSEVTSLTMTTSEVRKNLGEVIQTLDAARSKLELIRGKMEKGAHNGPGSETSSQDRK